MKSKRILVVAPHPDDETLGCGGTLLRHKAEGDEIHWLIMTTLTEQAGYKQEQIDARKREIDDVTKQYAFSSVHQAEFATTMLDLAANKDLVDEVSKVVARVKPDTIYTPFRNDVHSDHKAVFDAVAACTKVFRYPYVRRVRAYETLSETEFSLRGNETGFSPNLWVDISDYLDEKVEIMKLFRNEMGVSPFPRSESAIRALAAFRGGVAGVIAAESFVSLKEIV